MTTLKTSALLKADDNSNLSDVYINNAILYYAVVHKPKAKHLKPTEFEYSVTAFFDEETKEALEDMLLNKTFFKLDVTKNKKRVIKFDSERYSEVPKGWWGAQFSVPALSKAMKSRKPILCWAAENNSAEIMGEDQKAGTTITDEILVGNASIGSLRLFCYNNKEDLRNTAISVVAIKKLVPYEGGGGAAGTAFDDEFGFAIDYTREEPTVTPTTPVDTKAEMFGEDEYS